MGAIGGWSPTVEPGTFCAEAKAGPQASSDRASQATVRLFREPKAKRVTGQLLCDPRRMRSEARRLQHAVRGRRVSGAAAIARSSEVLPACAASRSGGKVVFAVYSRFG